MRYHLPRGMRYSSLDERYSFYRDEFRLDRVSGWLSRRRGRTVFAVIIGRHTKIYPPEFRENFSKTILIEKYRGLKEVRNLLLRFRPEAVYYDRTVYSGGAGGSRRIVGQELAFDLDPENLTCPVHGSLKEKMRRRQGLSFCMLEFRKIRDETLRLYERLAQIFFELSIVYSGRGFHIHVLDPETVLWPRSKRRRLALKLKGEGYPLDEWVTTGGMRLIRLPYSLHGMVSRVVVPLSPSALERFSPLSSRVCLPRFLRRA